MSYVMLDTHVWYIYHNTHMYDINVIYDTRTQHTGVYHNIFEFTRAFSAPLAPLPNPQLQVFSGNVGYPVPSWGPKFDF